MVVTATRSENSAFATPVTISVVDQQEIQEQNATTFTDLLDGVAGVTLSGAGPWETTPTIRGMGTNRVLVLFDGDRETNLWAGRAPLEHRLSTAATLIGSKWSRVPLPCSTAATPSAASLTSSPRRWLWPMGDTWQAQHHIGTRYSSVDDGVVGNYTVHCRLVTASASASMWRPRITTTMKWAMATSCLTASLRIKAST